MLTKTILFFFASSLVSASAFDSTSSSKPPLIPTPPTNNPTDPQQTPPPNNLQQTPPPNNLQQTHSTNHLKQTHQQTSSSIFSNEYPKLQTSKLHLKPHGSHPFHHTRYEHGESSSIGSLCGNSFGGVAESFPKAIEEKKPKHHRSIPQPEIRYVPVYCHKCDIKKPADWCKKIFMFVLSHLITLFLEWCFYYLDGERTRKDIQGLGCCKHKK